MTIMPTAMNGFVAVHALRDTLPVQKIQELQDVKARPEFQPNSVPTKGLLGWGLGTKIDVMA